MLNKDICMNCCKKNRQLKLISIMDEIEWKNKKINCPWKFSDKISCSIKFVPEWCPYKLEHLLKGE